MFRFKFKGVLWETKEEITLRISLDELKPKQ